MRRWFSFIGIVALLMAAVATSAPVAYGQIDIAQEITDQLNQSGQVPVIVNLALAARPESELNDARLVQMQRAAIQSSQSRILSNLDAAHISGVKRFQFVPAMALTVDATSLKQLASQPGVQSIALDQLAHLDLLESTVRMGATLAWAAGYTGNGQTVAILDTGVDRTHPFFGGRVVAEGCFSSTVAAQSSTTLCPNGQDSQTGVGAGVNCTTSIHGCDHGTHVAGIAAGHNNTMSGVAPSANIIAVQVFSQFNSDSICGAGSSPCVLSFTSDQVRGLEYVYSLRNTYSIASVNMSLGGGQYNTNCDAEPNVTATKAAIDNLRAANTATVIASGNEYLDGAMGSPGCISTAISVGSTTDTGTETVSAFSNSASFLSLLAPGEVIYSSVPGGGYGDKQGTSMATPHVAGAWAVVRSKKPSATVDQILTAFQTTGVMINDGRNNIIKPRIQLDQALNQFTTAPLNNKAMLPMMAKPGTVTPPPPADPLQNGDFEQGHTADWVENSTNFPNQVLTNSGLPSGVVPQGGSWLAWLGGTNSEVTDLSQTFTVAASGGDYLHYYYRIGSQDICGYDTAKVLVNATELATYDLCTSNNTAGWVGASVNLSAYRGQSVTVHFTVSNDSSSNSNFFLDTVAIQAAP